MRVGILTFHHTTNYGATLQAYALAKTVRSLGHTVECIDYRPALAIAHYRKALLPTRPAWFGNLAKAWKARQFIARHLPLAEPLCTTHAQLKAYQRRYDAVICGSDQIWCIDSFRGYDPAFFLDFVDGEVTRKVSYAASCGFTTSFGGQRTSIQALLTQFDALSVRDSQTAQLVREACGLAPTLVLDPTLLTDYGEFLRALPRETPYLLIYKLARLTPAEQAFVTALARRRNLRIVSVGYRHRLAERSLVGIDPAEWLQQFAGAAAVLTDSFHGTIFSILFRKPFYLSVIPGKAGKLRDLATTLHLEHRILGEGEPPADALDYAPVLRDLDGRIAASRAFLARALAQTSPRYAAS